MPTSAVLHRRRTTSGRAQACPRPTTATLRRRRSDQPYIAEPADLAQAINARFAANSDTLAGITDIYETQAGDAADLPYLVFEIRSGLPILTTDIHYVYDQRVTFTTRACTQASANRLREKVIDAFGTGSYTFQSGYSIPFFETNRSEKKEMGPRRGPNATYVFLALIEYSARTHRG